MYLILKNYFYCLFHPFKGLLPNGVKKNIGMFELVDRSTYFSGKRPLALAEYLAVSWPFVMLDVFYTLTVFPLAKLLSGQFGHEIFSSHFLVSPLYTTIIELFSLALFPLTGFIYVKVWNILIEFFLEVLGCDYDSREVELISSNSLVAKSYLALPFVGPFLSKIMSAFYLFAGLKTRLGLNNLQATTVILMPIILTLLLFAFFIFMISLFIAMI